MKKKKRAIIVIAIAAVAMVTLAVCLPLYFVNYDFNRAFWSAIPTGLPEDFTVTAHSGCGGSAPDSIESMRVGYESGAEIVEIDLNFNERGECVLSHDEPKEREYYVTLDEALSFLASTDLRANLDLKSTKNLPIVYETIEKYSLKDRVFFTGAAEDRIEEIKRDCPGVGYYLNAGGKFNTEEAVSGVVMRAQACGALGVNLHYSDLTRRLVEVCHKNGLSVSVYTVDKPHIISHVLLYRPDNVTTRRPAEVKKHIDSRPNN